MPGILPLEIIERLCEQGLSQEEAEARFIRWCGWRGLATTGLFYRVSSALDGTSVVSPETPPPPARRDIPRRFWHFIERAGNSPHTRRAVHLSANTFAFVLTVDSQRATNSLPAGRYQDTWTSVLVDEEMARALLLHSGSGTNQDAEPQMRRRPTVARVKDAQEWLEEQFRDEDETDTPHRAKPLYRNDAVDLFNISARTFDQQVWPPAAARFGRDRPGAKHKN